MGEISLGIRKFLRLGEPRKSRVFRFLLRFLTKNFKLTGDFGFGMIHELCQAIFSIPTHYSPQEFKKCKDNCLHSRNQPKTLLPIGEQTENTCHVPKTLHKPPRKSNKGFLTSAYDPSISLYKLCRTNVKSEGRGSHRDMTDLINVETLDGMKN